MWHQLVTHFPARWGPGESRAVPDGAPGAGRFIWLTRKADQPAAGDSRQIILMPLRSVRGCAGMWPIYGTVVGTCSAIPTL